MVIKNIKDTNISYEELVNVMHESFKERLAQGLHFTCSSITVEQFKSKTFDGEVFCAIDENTGELMGTGTIHIRKDKEGITYAYNEYLAVLPAAKRQGIGKMIYIEREREARKAGAKYIMSDTACKATSSVQWHLNMGFKIWELESYRSTNYWSYVFIKFLDKSYAKNDFVIRLHYLLSFLFIKSTRTINGTDNLLGKIYKSLKRICKN